MRGAGSSATGLNRYNPEQETKGHSQSLQKWKQRSTQSLKFKRIERIATQVTLPALQLSPVRRPPKTLQTVLSNIKRIDDQKRRQHQNRAILDGYLASYHIKVPPPAPPRKPAAKDNVAKCYSKQVVDGALAKILNNRDLLSQLDDEHLQCKVRNTLKTFSCYSQLMDFISDVRSAKQLLQSIYQADTINYDMAREIVKADEAIRKCITTHQTETLNSINGEIQKEHNSVIDLFNRLNYKMARKSTDYRQKLILLETLKKIDLNNRSFLQAEGSDIATDLRIHEERMGKFDKINPLVLNHSRLLLEESNKLRNAFS